MALSLQKPVVLVGMMGAGKTAIGRSLAEFANVSFLDSDEVIEERANLKIAEIFEKFGEAFFREKEAQVIENLIENKPIVLATGGGAFNTETTRNTVNRLGFSVWMNADLELIWKRVRDKTHRPLLQADNPKEVLTKLMADRRDIYAQASATLDIVEDVSIEATRNRLVDLLKSRNVIKAAP